MMTKAMREAATAKRASVRWHLCAAVPARVPPLMPPLPQAFSRALVRVELPGDDGLVLEAAFAPLEPLRALRELVSACLVPEAATAFYLFTAPPKARLVRDAAAALAARHCRRADLQFASVCCDGVCCAQANWDDSFYVAKLVPAARVHCALEGAARAVCVMVSFMWRLHALTPEASRLRRAARG